MEIPASLLRELTREVNALSGAAQAQASMAIGDILAEWDGEDVEALRTAASAVLDALLSTYAGLSAARAAEFYDASREAQMVRREYRAVADSRRDPMATEGAIRAIVRFAADGDVGRFRREALDRVDTEVRRAANECVAYNVGRDPAKPLYARVPAGETCGFCLMLASFGFQYRSREAASHSHRKCDCRVVPDFGDATVPGYDPNGMYARYSGCLSTLGGRDGVRAEWDALPKDERDAYVAARGKKPGKAFDAWLNKRVAQEIEARDPDWFRDGKIPQPKYTKPRAALEEHEKAGVDWLRLNGFALETIPEDPKAVANLDLKMNGRLWEMKNVTNAGSSVKNQVARAKKKWAKLGNPGEAHVVLTLAGCSDTLSDVAEAVKAMGEFRQILVIGAEGVIRIRK